MQTTLDYDEVDKGGFLSKSKDGNKFIFYKKSLSQPIEIDIPTFNGEPVLAPRNRVIYTETGKVFEFPYTMNITSPCGIFLRWKPVLIVSGERGISVRVETEDDLDWAYEQFVRRNPVPSIAENLDSKMIKTLVKLKNELTVLVYDVSIPLRYVSAKLYSNKPTIYPKFTKPCEFLAKYFGFKRAKMQGFVFVRGFFVPLYVALARWYYSPFFLTEHTLKNPKKWFGDFVKRSFKPLLRASKVLYNLPIPNPLIEYYDHPLYEWRQKYNMLPEGLIYKLYYIIQGDLDKDCLTKEDINILRDMGSIYPEIKRDFWLILD